MKKLLFFFVVSVIFAVVSGANASNLSPNAFIVEDDGTLISSGYAASDNGLVDIGGQINQGNVIKKFFKDHPGAKNSYDFIIFATNFKPGDNIGQFTATKKVIQGTGASNEDVNLVSTYYVTGLNGEEKFQGYAFIMNIDDLSDDLYLPIHEISHRWLFRLGDYDSCGKGFGCTKETGFKINKDGGHFNNAISTITKVGNKSYIDPNGGGSLQLGTEPGYCLDFGGSKDYRFTSLSLYLMGLVPANEVVPLKWYTTSGAWSDKGVPCVEKKFSVEDVNSLVGSRSPAYPNTQKDFSVAYLLLTKKGQAPTSSQINKMNFLAENFPKKWAEATSYKSTINTNTVNLPETHTTPPNLVSSTNISKYNFGNVTLKNGSTGEAVKELQRFLNAKLNLGLIIDGKLGPKTIVVIKKWQKDHGLLPDGLIGAKTKTLMNSFVQ